MIFSHKILYLIILVSIACTSCSSNKKLTDEVKNQNEIDAPCTDSGNSDHKFFRACANATSNNISLSKEKAIAEAKTQIAKQIINDTRLAATQYATYMLIADKQSFYKTMELAANKTADTVLKGIRPICEKYSEANGRYTTYISLEIDKQTVLSELNRRAISLIQDFNGTEFGKSFCNRDN